MINPYVFPIKGDISRADAVVLFELALSQKGYIYEFGSGGSTIFLNFSGNQVVSFDHDKGWIERTKKNIDEYCEKLKSLNNTKFELVDYKEDQKLWKSKILTIIKGYYQPPFLTLVDGQSGYRNRMLNVALEYSRENSYILFHDCRSGEHLKTIFDEVFKFKEKVESIHISYRDSNMALIKIGPRKSYVNWNDAEKNDSRVNWWSASTGLENEK